MTPADKIAKELSDLGRSDARLLDRIRITMAKLTEYQDALEVNRKARCELLCSVVADHSHTIGLSAAAADTVIAPKED